MIRELSEIIKEYNNQKLECLKLIDTHQKRNMLIVIVSSFLASILSFCFYYCSIDYLVRTLCALIFDSSIIDGVVKYFSLAIVGHNLLKPMQRSMKVNSYAIYDYINNKLQ